MTQAEIAKKYGVSQSAISLWKKDGCNLDDPRDVERFAEAKTARSRGITRKRKLAHIDTQRAMPAGPAQPARIARIARIGLTAEHRAKLSTASPDAFVDLPAVCTQAEAQDVLYSIQTLRQAFATRLDELTTIGHAHSIYLATAELAEIEQSLARITAVLEGFDA